MRRPSPALIVSSLALLVAAGVPAEAAKLLDGQRLKPRSVTGKAIKPRSIGIDRLRADAVRALTATPLNEVAGPKVLDRSLSGADLADESLGAQQIGPNGVGASELASRSVDFDEIVDGGLAARDVGSFGGTFDHDLGPLDAGACTSVAKDAAELGPREGVSRTVFDDVILVTPPASFPATVLVQAAAAGPRALALKVCNLGTGAVDPPNATFRYLTFDF